MANPGATYLLKASSTQSNIDIGIFRVYECSQKLLVGRYQLSSQTKGAGPGLMSVITRISPSNGLDNPIQLDLSSASAQQTKSHLLVATE
jgi:hypothetical protein